MFYEKKKKEQSDSVKNVSLSKQLNEFRLMIVNKKDQASVFWWEEEKQTHCFNSSFSSGVLITY